METKGHYTIVGFFVLIFIVCMVAFVVWISKVSLSNYDKTYLIYFKGSVSGLREDSDVRYRGIPVGNVSSIRLDPKNVERAIVEVSIQPNVPIKEDVVASLELQGITGNTYVQLNGGTKKSHLLHSRPGERYPVIPSRSSTFEEVVDSLPTLMKKATEVIEGLRHVFSQDNIQTFQHTLKNVSDFSDSLKGFQGTYVSKDVHEAVDQFKKTFVQLEKAGQSLNSIFEENRTGLKNFSANSLRNLDRAFAEVSEAASSFKRIGESLERSPTRFLTNDPGQGYQVKK